MHSQCCLLQSLCGSTGVSVYSSRSNHRKLSSWQRKPRQCISAIFARSPALQDKEVLWRTSFRNPRWPPTSNAIRSRTSKFARAGDGSLQVVDHPKKAPEVSDTPYSCPDVVHATHKPEDPTEEENKKEKNVAVEEDEDDFPLWMEEEDPNWPEDDPLGEGVGFQVGNFFEPRIENVPRDPNDSDEDSDDDGEELDINWEAEQYQWIVREISSSEWELVALNDPTPLIYFGFERYGPRGPECWKMLEAIEDVVRRIINSRKYPVRAVKSDINVEPDLAAALNIKEVPSILFINGGKLVYRLCGLKTADELLAITSHLFYHSVRPDCMEENEHSHSVKKRN